jgi:pilus assembly protein Flp/PilA
MLYQASFWLKDFLGKFSREEGQGLVEYALILVLIAIVVIAALELTGTSITDIFNDIAEALGGTAPTDVPGGG